MATKKAKAESDIKSIYVIAGKDDFLVGNQCQALLDKLIEPSQRQMGLLDADPDEAVAVEILDELRTLPFLTSRRVVLIKNADDFVSDNRDILEKYFDNPSLCGVLILTVSSWPSNTKLAKKLSNVGELISVEELKSWHLPQFVSNHAASLGKFISKENAEKLVELVGDEPGRLASEVEKVALYADNHKTITAAHIEAVIGHDRLYNAFAAVDAMTAGDPAKAIDRLRRMFAADRDAQYTVIGAFAYQFRRMFSAKAMLQKGSNQYQICSKLRVPRSSEGDFFMLISRLSLEQIGNFLQELVAADYAIKTGQMSAPVAMEKFVIEVAGACFKTAKMA